MQKSLTKSKLFYTLMNLLMSESKPCWRKGELLTQEHSCQWELQYICTDQLCHMWCCEDWGLSLSASSQKVHRCLHNKPILNLETHTCNNKIVLWTSHNYHWNLKRSTLLWLLPDEQNNRNCIVFLVCHATWLSTLVLIRHKLNSQTCPLQSGTMMDNKSISPIYHGYADLSKSLCEKLRLLYTPKTKREFGIEITATANYLEGAS